MKQILTLIAAAMALATLLPACSSTDKGSSSSLSSSGSSSSMSVPESSSGRGGYRDGIYRGAYVEGGVNQVGVQFTLEDNIIKDISFRSLSYGGVDYLAEGADEATQKVAGQYQELIDYLVGKDITDGIDELYSPGDIATDVDAFTAATVRSGKVISAINDALNRDAYSLLE